MASFIHFGLDQSLSSISHSFSPEVPWLFSCLEATTKGNLPFFGNERAKCLENKQYNIRSWSDGYKAHMVLDLFDTRTASTDFVSWCFDLVNI